MTLPNTNTFAPAATTGHSQSAIPVLNNTAHVAVVGAGAFGSWTAYFLRKKGYRVTLIDAWGAGNSRSSSGDETRVIRSTYGSNELYFDLNVRALQLWKEHEKIFSTKMFFNTSVLWFCYDEHAPLVDDSIPFSEKNAMPYEYLNREDLSKKFPLIQSHDLHHAYLDPFGGYLAARDSCTAVVKNFVDNGGKYIQNFVKPGNIKDGTMRCLNLLEGNKIEADLYLFACGSWLGQLFPEVLSTVITCSKQEVYYFGVPAAHSSAYDNLPVWIDLDGEDFYYGIPGNKQRGFKIGVDRRGKPFDPTKSERTLELEVLDKARMFIAHRFPGLTNAPLLENRVCPYENSPDGNFIFDVHPQAGNVVFLGGGSGHGFKHGPALGELVSMVLTGERKAPNLFSLARFKGN